MRKHFVNFFAKIKDWILTHKKISIAIGVVLAISLVVGGYFFFQSRKPVQRTDSSAETKEADIPKLVASPLTGIEVTQDLAKRPVIGVMIENSPDARPQSGLAEAGVVFEAIAEGGITRFLALYQEDTPAHLGPVRSLRPYYLDWSLSFDAAVAHVGGSPDALSRAKSELGKKDLDQFRYGTKAFDRVSFRLAPHNVYTSMERLLSLAREAGITGSNFTSLARKTKSPSATPNATSITANFSTKTFQAGWTYDAANNNYARSTAGVAQADRDSSAPIKADVVVVIKASYTSAGGSGRQAVATTAGGEAYIFQDGTVTKGSWSRPNNSSQFTFKDINGVEVKLNPGRTWFEVIPTNQSVTYQ